MVTAFIHSLTEKNFWAHSAVIGDGDTQKAFIGIGRTAHLALHCLKEDEKVLLPCLFAL